MFLALLLLLTETVVKVPASHWTAIRLNIEQNSTSVFADFEVRNGSKKSRQWCSAARRPNG